MHQATHCIGVALLISTMSAANAQSDVTDIVAAQLRAQGYVCNNPTGATKDALASRPNAAVWVITCENATYRATLIPGMAAKVEVIEQNSSSPSE